MGTSENLLTRRSFLAGSAAAVAALGLAGCSSDETPAEGTSEEPTDTSAAVEQLLADMTLEQKLHQLFFVTPEAIIDIGTATAAGDATRQALVDHPVGGLIYFSQNLLDPEQTTEMLANTAAFGQEACGIAPFLAVDEEGGLVARIAENPAFGVENVGNMRAIGDTGDPAQAQVVGETIADYLSQLGFTVDFAPVCDVAEDPASSLYDRSFGSDPELVASMVSAEVQALLEGGILPCAKHFPGIGNTEGDSHDGSISLELSAEELANREFIPFKAAIDAGVPFVMLGHLSLPNVSTNGMPASLSPEVIELLRNQLGFDGIVLTDAMNMGAALEAAEQAGETGAALLVEAGGDMILMPANFGTAYAELENGVATGRITEARIDESVRRILQAKMKLGA